jgi:hypothetical protein
MDALDPAILDPAAALIILAIVLALGAVAWCARLALIALTELDERMEFSEDDELGWR